MKHWINNTLAAATMAAGLGFSAAAFAQTPVTFQMNWTAGGPNAGFAAALGEGYYKAAGLDVTIVQGNGSGNTAQLVASGRSQLAYADAVAVAQLIAKGAQPHGKRRLVGFRGWQVHDRIYSTNY